MIELDEKARIAIEVLARSKGGFDEALVTTSALRPLLRRRQNDVFSLIKIWKAGLRAAEAAAAETANAAAAERPSEPVSEMRAANASEIRPVGKPEEQAAGATVETEIDVASSARQISDTGAAQKLAALNPFDSSGKHDRPSAAEAAVTRGATSKLAMLLDLLESEPVAPVNLREAARRARSDKSTVPVSNIGELCPACPSEAPEHKPPYMRKAEARAEKLETFSTFAIEYLQAIGRPAGAREIYDAATVKKLKLNFVRPSAIDVLVDADQTELKRLDNGLFWLAGLAVPSAIPPDSFHSRRLKRHQGAAPPNDTVVKPASIRNQEIRAEKLAAFAAFAVKFLTEIGRPAGPAEIFDAAKIAGKAAFARKSAGDVLSDANDPDLRKLPHDGNFWLTARLDVPAERSARYYPRIRKEGYKTLGKELLAILTACSCAMTAAELLVRLAPDTREMLPSHHASFAFKMAVRHFPQIIRAGYGLWYLDKAPETRPRHLSLEDEFAIAAIEAVRLQGPSTPAEIIGNLPPHLRRLFPNIPAALDMAAKSFRQLQFDGEKWFVPANVVILVQAARR